MISLRPHRARPATNRIDRNGVRERIASATVKQKRDDSSRHQKFADPTRAPDVYHH